MKTILVLILTIVSFVTASAQPHKNSTATKQASGAKPEFKNQGEAEDYNAKKFFEESYKVQFFKRYKGPVIVINENTFNYDDKTFKVFNTSQELKTIFKKGIFYPDIITGNKKFHPKSKEELDTMSQNKKIIYNMFRADSLTIGTFEELKFLEKSPTKKRFRFWLFRIGSLNPTVCFIELSNKNATSKTDILTFINGSTLTFYKEGWIII